MDRSYIANLPLVNFFQVTLYTVGRTYFVTCNTTKSETAAFEPQDLCDPVKVARLDFFGVIPPKFEH